MRAGHTRTEDACQPPATMQVCVPRRAGERAGSDAIRQAGWGCAESASRCALTGHAGSEDATSAAVRVCARNRGRACTEDRTSGCHAGLCMRADPTSTEDASPTSGCCAGVCAKASRRASRQRRDQAGWLGLCRKCEQVCANWPRRQRGCNLGCRAGVRAQQRPRMHRGSNLWLPRGLVHEGRPHKHRGCKPNLRLRCRCVCQGELASEQAAGRLAGAVLKA